MLLSRLTTSKINVFLFTLSMIFVAQVCCATSTDFDLYHAAREGNMVQVKILIRKQVDIESTFTELRRTALQTASFNGHIDVVRLLLSVGTKVNKSDKDGWTALLLASSKEYSHIVGVLLSGGADVNSRTHGGSTPLGIAIKKRNEALGKMLVKFGAKINATNTNNNTVLQIDAMGEKSLHSLLPAGTCSKVKGCHTPRVFCVQVTGLTCQSCDISFTCGDMGGCYSMPVHLT